MMQEFSQEIEETARAVVNEVHTALPGTILFFDTKKGTASVQPVGEFVTSDGKQLSYPVITEAPIVFPFCQQAGVGIVFPVKKGDSCLIVISEVELDAWRRETVAEGSLRFDLSSAVVIPGLMKGGSDLIAKAVKQEAVILAASETEVSLSCNGIQAKAGGTLLTARKNSTQVEVGNARLTVSDGFVQAQVAGTELRITKSVVAVKGDLAVSGNFSYTGSYQ